MKAEEIEYLHAEVKLNIIPEIKAAIPTFLAWALGAIFPKLESKLIILITKIVEHILKGRK